METNEAAERAIGVSVFDVQDRGNDSQEWLSGVATVWTSNGAEPDRGQVGLVPGHGQPFSLQRILPRARVPQGMGGVVYQSMAMVSGLGVSQPLVPLPGSIQTLLLVSMVIRSGLLSPV